MHINEFPDQNYIGKILGTFYDPKIKPVYLSINYLNSTINIRYRHNDFIDIFGDDLNMDEVISCPGEFTYEKKFYHDKLLFIISTHINNLELISKKLTKMWSVR